MTRIPGNATKILIVDDTTRSNVPARTLMFQGHDVLLLNSDSVPTKLMSSWCDLIVLVHPSTAFEETVASSTYLEHVKVIRCYE